MIGEDIATMDYMKIRHVYDFIMLNMCNYRYKNIIASSAVCSILQDCSEFMIEPTKGEFISPGIGLLYQTGKLNGVPLWVDPYMKWSDNRIFLFDNVDIDIFDINFSIKSEATFAPRLIADAIIAIDIPESKELFIITSKSSPEYQKYLSIERDRKINNLLK